MLIRVFAGLAVLTAAGLGVLLASTAGATRDRVELIGHQAAPQVANAADLYLALSDMEGQAVDVFLAEHDQARRKQALDNYEQRRLQVDKDLQLVAAAGGSDQVTAEVVRRMLDQLGRYEMLTYTAVSGGGAPGTGALDLYLQTAAPRHDIIDAATTLIKINQDNLDRAYESGVSLLSAERLGLGLIGAAALTPSIALQILLARRTRRLLNPAAATATVLLLITITAGFGLVGTERDQIDIAKRGSFDSIITLAQARALSHRAKADESRYLANPAQGADEDQKFKQKSQTLTESLDAVGRNSTVPGGKEALDRVRSAFQAYQRDDQTLRRMATGGDRAEAIAFNAGQCRKSFERYDAELVSLIAINQRAFDSAIAVGQTALNGWTGLFPLGGAALVTLFVIAGTWPRLAEYR